MLSEQVAALYREHHEAICRFARLLLADPGEADDVAQELYQKLLEGRTALPSLVTRAWLYRVVLNACRDRRKSWWFRVRKDAVDADVPRNLIDQRPTPEAKLLDLERDARLCNLLQHLPSSLRTVIILKDVEGLSYEDIATALGCSIGTVSSRLNRARKMLARKLRRVGW